MTVQLDEPDYLAAERAEALAALVDGPSAVVTHFDRRLHSVESGLTSSEGIGSSDVLGGLTRVDWGDLFAGISHEEPIVDGLLFAGRLTAVVARPKAGKSEFALSVCIPLARGIDPFTGMARPSVVVFYLDGEMGRLDVLERVEARGLTVGDLDDFHYFDLPVKLDHPTGAGALLAAVDAAGAGVVVLDGLNAFVTGAEKDDQPWRDLYTYTIAPLKRRGVAVLSIDNMGKDTSLGPRGSSVKMDKADAILQLTRTDDGVELKATHRRTAAYPAQQTYQAVLGDDDETPVAYRHASTSWPAGTAEKADELDRAAVPLDASSRTAAAALRCVGVAPGKNAVLVAAIRYRRRREGVSI